MDRTRRTAEDLLDRAEARATGRLSAHFHAAKTGVVAALGPTIRRNPGLAVIAAAVVGAVAGPWLSKFVRPRRALELARRASSLLR